MPSPGRIRIAEFTIIIVLFTGCYLFASRYADTVMAAENERVWVDDEWNILTLVPEGWEWREDVDDGVPVVFIPAGDEDKGIPDFVFVTYLGKQSSEKMEKLKNEYIKALEKDLDNFLLNSTEKVTTEEALPAYDLIYTFTVKSKGKKSEALGHDRLVFTQKNIFWAISFSAGKDDFKRLKEDAMSIVDAFVFDAAAWLEKKQEKQSTGGTIES